MLLKVHIRLTFLAPFRGVVSRYARLVNPIPTRGTDYAYLITTGTPRFSDLPTAMNTYHIKYHNMAYLL